MEFEETLRVIEITEETPDVKTYTLEKGKVDFIPGQYALISLPDLEQVREEERPFTFACSPARNYVALTIKKTGFFTGIIHKQIRKGNSLRLRGPFGESLNIDMAAKRIALIAGGSGITPFKSMIDYVLDKQLNMEVCLFFSNRTEEDIIYRKQFDKILQENIKIVCTLTNEKPEGWKGELGFINAEMIQRHLEKPREWLYYFCGPPPMISAVKQSLIGIGITEDRFRIEDWMVPGKHDKTNA
ncbi:MAG: hypothetical protein V1837_08230 [Candidatus Woesearchaeota archaeon]